MSLLKVFAQATGSSLTESVAFCMDYPWLFDSQFTQAQKGARKFAETSADAARRIKEERAQWKSEHSVTD